MSVPTLRISFDGAELAPPEAFAAESEIGQAYTAYQAAAAAEQEGQQTLQGAESELRGLDDFLRQAGLLTDMGLFAKKQARATLVRGALPHLRHAAEQATKARQQTYERHAARYGSYQGAVASLNGMCALNDSSYLAMRVSDWLDQLEAHTRVVAQYAQQLEQVAA